MKEKGDEVKVELFRHQYGGKIGMKTGKFRGERLDCGA
jgi:hypothetical protein